MQCQHYITHCVSHQNACNYSFSTIGYTNYIDNYDSRESLHLIPKITFFYLQYWLKVRNETLKQALIFAIAKTVLIVPVSVPPMAHAKPTHIDKTPYIQSLSSSKKNDTLDVSNIYNKSI